MARKDPEGKRIARMRADTAAEALELLNAVTHRLGRLGLPDVAQALENLRRDLRRFQTEESGRGQGHLEPRAKYKGRSQHLAVESGRGVVTLYLDESGQAIPSPDQPVFVLAGVAMTDDQSEAFTVSSDRLKDKFGLPRSLTLHGPKIEKGVDEFSFDDNLAKQAEFRLAVEQLIESSSFQLLGAIIRKDALATDLQSGENYGNLPPGLYEMALTFVAERFVDMLFCDQKNKPCGCLVFESIGNLEDALHQRAFADLLIHGSEFVSDGCFRGWLRPGCRFKTKEGSHSLELADLAARALLTWTRAGFPDEHDFWRLWAKRISTQDEIERGKFGVKIFPDQDIREWVLEMRRRVKGLRDEA